MFAGEKWEKLQGICRKRKNEMPILWRGLENLPDIRHIRPEEALFSEDRAVFFLCVAQHAEFFCLEMDIKWTQACLNDFS
jgi:hypothetical protein